MIQLYGCFGIVVLEIFLIKNQKRGREGKLEKTIYFSDFYEKFSRGNFEFELFDQNGIFGIKATGKFPCPEDLLEKTVYLDIDF